MQGSRLEQGPWCIKHHSMVEGQAIRYKTRGASAIHSFHQVPSSMAGINPFIIPKLSWLCSPSIVLLIVVEVEMKFQYEIWKTHSRHIMEGKRKSFFFFCISRVQYQSVCASGLKRVSYSPRHSRRDCLHF